MDKLDVDPDLVEKLAKMLEQNGLSEIEYTEGGRTIRVARGGGSGRAPAAAPVATAAAIGAAPAAGSGDADHPGAVTSPMVGTVYLAPEPGAANFVSAGDKVKQGDTLLIIEAMKVMNPIRAPRAGTVTQIVAADARPVEFGDVLLILE